MRSERQRLLRSLEGPGFRAVKTDVIGVLRLVSLLLGLMVANYASADTVPLEQHHGIYMVPVRINDTITLPFVIDSGASEVAIPGDVFLALTRSGSIGPSDALGSGTYKLADGSTQKSDRFLLREIRIGNKIIKNVVANVVPVAGDPLLGQSFLSKLSLWTVDNSRNVLILGDEGTEPNQTVGSGDEYKRFVQDGWLYSSKQLLSESGQLIMRRYAYEPQGGSFLNILLFFCPRQSKSFSVLDIVIPKNYTIKSFAKDSVNPKLPIRILTDNTSIWHFEADYKKGEMFIDRTPANYHAFDAVMNARELLIGFGIGDAIHYHLTRNMDAFMKEASAVVGSGSAELGDTTFMDRMAASRVCAEFQAGRYGPHGAAQTSSTGKFWVVRGTVSCPDCDPSKGKTSVDVKISKEKNGNMVSEAECKKVLNTYRSALVQKAKTVNLAIDLHCVRVSDPNIE